MRTIWLTGIASVLWLALGGFAFAICPGTNVLLLDNFDKLEPTWGEPNEAMKIVNGQLVMTPKAEQYFWQANSASVYDDIDMCATMTTIAGVTPEDAKAGLVFWYVDVNNF